MVFFSGFPTIGIISVYYSVYYYEKELAWRVINENEEDEGSDS